MEKSLSTKILSKQGNIRELIDKADDHKMHERNKEDDDDDDDDDSDTSLELELISSMKAYAPLDNRIEQWEKRKKLAEKTPSVSPPAKKRSPSPSTSKKRSPSPPAKKKKTTPVFT